jgi:hypothetical protein
MEAPDISVFEGVQLVDAEGTRSSCMKEPQLQEESKNRANYEKWDRMAKICVLVFACLYLVIFFVFLVGYVPGNPFRTRARGGAAHGGASSKSSLTTIAAVWEEGLIEEEIVHFDDDTTVWEGGEQQRQMEKRVEWQEEEFVIAAPIVNDEAVFQQYLKEKSNTFVAFSAPWCSWSQRMRPTWHTFAALSPFWVDDTELQVLEVNCGQAPILCKKESVLAFPTMRWYRDGKRFGHSEYRSDRTVTALLEYSEDMLLEYSEDMIHQEDASTFGNAPHENWARSISYSDSEGQDEEEDPSQVNTGWDDSEGHEEEDPSQVNTGWDGVPEQWLVATSLTLETFDEFITTNKNSFVAFTSQGKTRR